ncbi:hypothetical protein ISF_09582 [Cordyceps fumosorosea ARSEF 2679]|uniref:Uncharacterized protein n=1 Tax=Cordyceps fumosorosea (strain ARSEF 2679) TaxID=1081104 RepID=A0A167FT38_CORFA|nr:hypothetical protein ISF_09582 [Cordyceps fumosorosea ARSEF 2679]OAA45714.1 hypothetical protein ISF_09582 [Cordyceps fumosorosea ARSEF 2679]
MTSMGCHEESLHYLNHIKDFWHSVFDGNESAMMKLDRTSLEALQLKAPGACEKHARDLHARVRSGDILGAFNEAERERIWSKIRDATVDCTVPSLNSFFEDRKYIEDAAHCIKMLLPPGRHKTIRSALEDAYPEVDEQGTECLVQVSSSSFKAVATDGTDHFDLAYRQLWLYARRHFEDMPHEREQIVAGYKTAGVDEMVLFDFASLAYKLGFRTTEIERLLKGNPDRQIAHRLLKMARKPDQFYFEDIESSISAVTTVMEAARPICNNQDVDVEEPEVIAAGATAKQCGRPLVSDHVRCKPLLFLDKLHATMARQNRTLSSFFIQRSTYFAFFGKDLAISCEAMRDAPEARSVQDVGMDIERASEIITASPQTRARMEIASRESECQTKLRTAQREAADAESRLQMLLTKERQQTEKLAGLEDAITARAAESAATEKNLQDKFEKLKQREVEQVIRLETLAAKEPEQHAHMKQLEQGRADMEGDIRLDCIATNLEATAEDEDASGTERLLQVSAQLSEKQNELNRLEEMERNKRLVIRQLEEEEVRLRSSIDDLSMTVRALTEDEQAKGDSIASLKEQYQSTNKKLVEKEMGLRQNIDFLEVCRERLEADIKAATEEKDVLSQAPLVNSTRGGSQDIDELRQATERRQPLENVPLSPGEGRAEEDGAVGLEYMIRGAFDSEEEHLAPTEDIPLPLFSRALPAASDRPLEAPMGNQTEETIEV